MSVTVDLVQVVDSKPTDSTADRMENILRGFWVEFKGYDEDTRAFWLMLLGSVPNNRSLAFYEGMVTAIQYIAECTQMAQMIGRTKAEGDAAGYVAGGVGGAIRYLQMERPEVLTELGFFGKEAE